MLIRCYGHKAVGRGLPQPLHSRAAFDETLSRHTSLGVGGPVDVWVEPADLEELAQALRWAGERHWPVVMLGSGTNLLANDRGFRGVVIRLSQPSFRRWHVVEDTPEVLRVRCGAGLPTNRLVSQALREPLVGAERLAGLPGTVGGAIAMNAQEIGQFVESVTLIERDGTVVERPRRALVFQYRWADLGGSVVVQAVLRFQRTQDLSAMAAVRQALDYRRTTQELTTPSAGCAFKNPSATHTSADARHSSSGGRTAGFLIDRSGLKGRRIGDACVSARHANFILNMGHATSADILRLMELMRDTVWKDHQVALEPEIRILGERL